MSRVNLIQTGTDTGVMAAVLAPSETEVLRAQKVVRVVKWIAGVLMLAVLGLLVVTFPSEMIIMGIVLGAMLVATVVLTWVVYIGYAIIKAFGTLSAAKIYGVKEDE